MLNNAINFFIQISQTNLQSLLFTKINDWLESVGHTYDFAIKLLNKLSETMVLPEEFQLLLNTIKLTSQLEQLNKKSIVDLIYKIILNTPKLLALNLQDKEISSIKLFLAIVLTILEINQEQTKMNQCLAKINQDLSAENLKRTMQKLQLEFHPDRNPNIDDLEELNKVIAMINEIKEYINQKEVQSFYIDDEFFNQAIEIIKKKMPPEGIEIEEEMETDENEEGEEELRMED